MMFLFEHVSVSSSLSNSLLGYFQKYSSHLDIFPDIDTDGRLQSIFYDLCDDFNFLISNIKNLYSKILTAI